MSATAPGPVGPIPGFRQPGGVKPWETKPVDVGRWQRLYPPDAVASPYRPKDEHGTDRVPQAPPPHHLLAGDDPAQMLRQKPVGLKRLGRQFETWRFKPYPSEVARLLPDPGIYGPPEPHDWTAITPFRWSVKQLPRAYLRALKIARSVGLEFHAPMQWVFRDAGGTWWMLPDYCGDLLGPDDDDGPNCWPIGPLDTFSTADVPYPFFEDLGGVDGPLEWAMEVLEHVSYARRMRGVVADRLRDLQQLTGTPEWATLAAAASRRGDLAVNNALHNLGYWIDQGGIQSVLADAYRTGFRAGDVLGYLSAAGAARASEAARSPGKVGLDQLLWEIIEAEGGASVVKPYVLAHQLVADRDSQNERGVKLAAQGLSASSKKVGERISSLIKSGGPRP